MATTNIDEDDVEEWWQQILMRMILKSVATNAKLSSSKKLLGWPRIKVGPQ